MTNSRQFPWDPSPPKVKYARTTTKRTPTVQKYSIMRRFFPRASAGRNSARISKGTVNPPTPTPTMDIKTNKCQYEPTNPTDMPKKDIVVADTRKTGFLPFLSASGPKIKVPIMAPKNSTEVIDALSSFVRPHSTRKTSQRNDSSSTCMASAAKQRPAAVRTSH